MNLDQLASQNLSGSMLFSNQGIILTQLSMVKVKGGCNDEIKQF